jgi:glycosyltransferase involved in cell wall biosynthesis
MTLPSVCFVGLENLPVLAPEYSQHPMGGAQLQQTLLARGLARRGWRVSMVVGDYGQPDGAAWADITTYRAYRPRAGLPFVRFVHPRWTSVWSAMGRADADIYYVSCAGMLLGEVALYARGQHRQVAFRIAHDTDCQPDKLLVPYWRDRLLYRYGLRHADIILAQTAAQRTLMRQNFGRECQVIPSLVAAADAARPLAARDIDLLWISNIRPFKRPDLALELARREPSLTLHMVGGRQPGSEQYYADIERQAAAQPNVVFHGHVPQESTYQLMARARLFLNTSDSEGFPNTYLQAWARGTPTVACFDPDGVIGREELGFPVRDIARMRTALHALLENEALWQATSARCQSYVAAHHGEPALDAFAAALGTIARRAPPA